MHTKMFLGGAAALSFVFAVGSASADDVRYGANGATAWYVVTTSNDTVTQTAVATLNSSVTAKFFKAEIGVFIPNEPEEPWEEPEEPEPEPEE